MPFIHKKGIPEEVEVSDSGRMAGVFHKGKLLKVFTCDDFDGCAREGKRTPQVEAEQFVRSLYEARVEAAKKPAQPPQPTTPDKTGGK